MLQAARQHQTGLSTGLDPDSLKRPAILSRRSASSSAWHSSDATSNPRTSAETLCGRLEELPESIGQASALVKIQASFNQLRSLPASLRLLPKLELFRVAANCIAEVRLCLCEDKDR